MHLNYTGVFPSQWLDFTRVTLQNCNQTNTLLLSGDDVRKILIDRYVSQWKDNIAEMSKFLTYRIYKYDYTMHQNVIVLCFQYTSQLL